MRLAVTRAGLPVYELSRAEYKARCWTATLARLSNTGRPPTLRELATARGLHSCSSVAPHMAMAKRLGLVDWKPTQSRTLHATGIDAPTITHVP